MDKVTTESEALQFCREHQCGIQFWNQSGRTPAHVIVSQNAWTKIIGRDLVEAVNRLIDVYTTAPCNFEKLDWWYEAEHFYELGFS